MKFSQRIGITPAEKILQIESIDLELKNSLWSVLKIVYWDTFNKHKFDRMGYRSDNISASNLRWLFRSLWLDYFKKPIDTIPTHYYDAEGGLNTLRNYFFKAEWYEVFDFLEFVSEHGATDEREGFVKSCNIYLERENSGYRFIDGKVTEISSSHEVDEIESALSKSIPYEGVRQHLSTAITLLSDRANPDYRNSIKESISAVESLCKKLSPKSCKPY